MANNAHNCPVYKKCGGCQLQNMEYPDQLSFKQAKVVGLLGKFCRVGEIIGMDSPYHYRNKVQAAFGKDRRGVYSGVYQSSSHRIVPVEGCMIEDETADRIVSSVRRLVRKFNITVYDMTSRRGFLRHVLVRRSFTTNQVMVVIVSSSAEFPHKKDFVATLLKEHPEITTIVHNVNDRSTALMLGNRSFVLFGSGFIEDELLSCRFRISPKSFYQVNPLQTEKLYSLAMEYLQLEGNETVLDAYCGTGTLGILAAKAGAGKVIGVEVNSDAVKDAKVNAELNKIENIEFVCDDASEFILKLAAEKLHLDSVIMDPPRAGSTVQFMRSVITLAPDRIVYVSCNPDTLKRDLLYFSKNGYKVRKITPVDMFPHTGHVETVVLLCKLKSTHHIEAELKTDELDLTSAESKATYDEIKAHVKKHTGLTVSSLNIAQVKQKCGIIERENYNKEKSKDSRQPKCPKEKEEAIVAALRYFKMI